MCMFNGRNIHQDQKVIVSENTRKGEWLESQSRKSGSETSHHVTRATKASVLSRHGVHLPPA